MQTLSPQQTPDASRGWETVNELRRVLTGLGADPDLVARVRPWADLGERGYVYVPPLPADLVAHLARLIPGR